MNQVRRVATNRQRGYPQIEVAGHRLLEAAQRGAGPGLVGVEGQHHPLGEPAKQIEVLLAERRSACGHGHRQSRPVQRDHVGVALDHHGFSPGDDAALGPVEAVEEAGLVIDRRLRRVQVLGPIALEKPRAEPDGISAQIADREHDPAPKPIDEASAAAA